VEKKTASAAYMLVVAETPAGGLGGAQPAVIVSARPASATPLEVRVIVAGLPGSALFMC
jgi:hypothetical protein